MVLGEGRALGQLVWYKWRFDRWRGGSNNIDGARVDPSITRLTCVESLRRGQADYLFSVVGHNSCGLLHSL